MIETADIQTKNNVISISGDLHLMNVMSVYRRSLPLFLAHHVTIDFSALKSSDSSGIALMIAWINYAKKHQQTISFQAIPDYLLAIVKLARMENIIAM